MSVDVAQALSFIEKLLSNGGPDGAYIVITHVVPDPDNVKKANPVFKWTMLPDLSRDLATWLKAYAARFNTYYGVGLRAPRAQPVSYRRGGKMSACALPLYFFSHTKYVGDM
jgi:hypothetical protein